GGYDTGAFWARSGMQHMLSPPGIPWPPVARPAFGDVVGGLAIAGAVSAALYRRRETGKPAVIDVSLLATGMWQIQTDIVNAAISEDAGPAPTAPDRFQVWNPLMLPYRTADARFVALMVLSPDPHWPALCQCLGRPDLATDPRFADMDARREHAAECVSELDAIFATRTLDEWRKALTDFEGEWAPVQTPREVLSDPQVQANGWVAAAEMANGAQLPLVTSPVQFDENPGRPQRAPEHGEHTEQVLLELGMSWDDISDLKQRGAVL
ncbi:MAG: CoA transferase, partial [Acidimicrobiaceae bacterium]|nr:CoA transferase [Acidimicrobiaceae bacterium]